MKERICELKEMSFKFAMKNTHSPLYQDITINHSLRNVGSTYVQPLCSLYTGFKPQNGFRSGWRCWSIAASTAIWRQNCSVFHISAE